ncbi:hypothetical protein [Methanosarcina horonobensis]|uniref:hypothetical protein n=1 Tax=Methanosarcina horonobensis TaxID=418008 RepID=UPI00064E1F0C|nr:hypothetical protein [Methanosarcina horonobensis]
MSKKSKTWTKNRSAKEEKLQVNVKDITESIKKATAKIEEVKDIIELVHSQNYSDGKAYILVGNSVKCP